MCNVNEAIEVTDDSSTNATDESSGGELWRRGDVNKCPVCGAWVDADAYHCSTCHNYYCYHCRARLVPSDIQLQCVNQECDYYGKLTCGVCDSLTEREEAPSIYAEPEDGYWPGWLALILLAAAITWYYAGYLWAVVLAILAYAVGGFLLHNSGVNLFGKERTVEQPRTSSVHNCIRCGQQVKEVGRTN